MCIVFQIWYPGLTNAWFNWVSGPIVLPVGFARVRLRFLSDEGATSLKRDSLSNSPTFRKGVCTSPTLTALIFPLRDRVYSTGYRRTIVLVAAIIIASGLAALTPARAQANDAVNATYVGADVCAGCHQAQAERWKASHHALAMEKANFCSDNRDQFTWRLG